MSTLKKLTLAEVVGFELSEDKTKCWVGELCDYYYSTELTKAELLTLIDELKTLADTIEEGEL